MRRTLLTFTALAALLLAGACGSEEDNESVASVDGTESGDDTDATEEISEEEAFAEFAQCMRDNGVEDFPDAMSGDEMPVNQELTEDPEFEDAMGTCLDELPSDVIGRGEGEFDEEMMLDFAECMRENGVEDMPDPGGDDVFGMREVLTDDPDFEAAVEACQDIIEGAIGTGDQG